MAETRRIHIPSQVGIDAGNDEEEEMDMAGPSAEEQDKKKIDRPARSAHSCLGKRVAVAPVGPLSPEHVHVQQTAGYTGILGRLQASASVQSVQQCDKFRSEATHTIRTTSYS